MNPAVLGGLLEVGKRLIDHWFPDPNVAAEKKLELAKMEQDGRLANLASFTELAKAQIGLNTAEVQSGHWLGRWRGGLGWVLAGSMAYQLVLHPFLVSIILIFDETFPVDKLPKLDWKQLGSVLLGMLGIGG